MESYFYTAHLNLLTESQKYGKSSDSLLRKGVACFSSTWKCKPSITVVFADSVCQEFDDKA